MSNEITKARIRKSDNETLKIVAMKITADKMRVVTTQEVLHALIKSFESEGNSSAEGIISAIRDKF